MRNNRKARARRRRAQRKLKARMQVHLKRARSYAVVGRTPGGMTFSVDDGHLIVTKEIVPGLRMSVDIDGLSVLAKEFKSQNTKGKKK